MAESAQRQAALEAIRNKRLQSASSATTSATGTSSHNTMNGQSRILAPSSSPITDRTASATSRFFSSEPGPSQPPPSRNPTINMAAAMQVDAPLRASRPPQPQQASEVFAPVARAPDGQPPRKKFAAESRESSVSDQRSSPVPTATTDITRSNSAVPSRLQDEFEHVKLQPGSPLARSRPASDEEPLSSPLGGEPSRLKRRPAPESPSVGGSSSSQSLSSIQSPSITAGVASQMKPELLAKIFIGLSVEQIEAIIEEHPFEDPKIMCLRLRALSKGLPFRPPNRDTPTKAAPPKKRDPRLTSAIYANRAERKAPIPASEASSLRSPPHSSISPMSAEHRFKPKKRRAIDSDSESGGWSDDDSDVGRGRRGLDDVPDIDEDKALEVFNTCEAETLTGSIVCSAEQAEIIKKLRPYKNVEDLQKKLTKTKGVSPGLFDQYIKVTQGYIDVDRCLSKCEQIGKEIADIMSIWTGEPVPSSKSEAPSGTATPNGINAETGLHVTAIDTVKLEEKAAAEQSSRKRKVLQSYMKTQPAGLKEGVKLKDYQLLGLNWLNLLYSKGLSCILADDMGLGKTIQVISFLQLLRDRGVKGPHCIIVPSSTLENWAREFEKFAPNLDVRTYYGSQDERRHLQREYKDMSDDGTLEVLLTTYDLAWKDDDNKFLRKRLQFECLIFDEGHTLKNFQSQRYTSLLRLQPRWRLLLTGTPLQNNLQELVSLLKFMHPAIFSEAEDSLRQIFKVHSKGTVNMLSQQRVSRARTMMTPFVLRRRKAQVLTDLPARTERVIECKMTPLQTRLYQNALSKNRTVIEEVKNEDELEDSQPSSRAKKQPKTALKKKDDTTNNVLMDLRKAASHPLLFRTHYDDSKLKQLAKACLKEPEFSQSDLNHVIEDMEVMTDAELHFFCKKYPKSCGKFALDEKLFLDVGKMEALQEIISDCKAQKKRMLLFSQLTQVLDILQTALDHLGVRWIRLDGSTRVDERQQLVDEFTEDEDITVFLLSTRAGGMGINLVAACVVCIYDQDFNPHNDRQAADRAYRIGQTREVEVIKLVSTGSIDEDMLQIGLTKLQLDDAVGGYSADAEAVDGAEGQKTETAVKKSLLTNLRAKLDSDLAEVTAKQETDVDVKME